jgi:MATE family multidrug resistance protein
VTYRQHLRQNLKLAIPVMLTNLGHVMMGVTDNMMVGHLSAVSLAGVGLALVVFNVLLLFGIGVSYAITPLVAEGHGEKNLAKITSAVKHGLIVNFLNSFVLILIVTFGKNLLYRLDQQPEVVAQALPFLSIVTW